MDKLAQSRAEIDRLDQELIRVLADTYPNATQGPVWYVGGRSV